MLSFENRFLDFIQKHVGKILVALVVAASLVVRFGLRGFLNGDLTDYLIPWLDALRSGGIRGVLAVENFDYNITYLFLLAPASLLPITEVACIKLVSVLFDYLAAFALAWLTGMLVGRESPHFRVARLGAFVGVLFLPVVLGNSALWGQCDMIYTLFLVLCLAFLLREKYTPAFAMFSVAVLFKLQAVFFLPVLVILYCTRRRFSILQFLQIPAALLLLGVASLPFGGGILSGFTTYFSQTQTYPYLYMNYPNIYLPLQAQPYEAFALAGIVYTLGLFVCVWAWFMRRRWQVEGDALVLFSVWSITTCCMFLPGMHDRYAFPAEVLVWVFFLCKPNARRLALALVSQFVAVVVYLRALFQFGLLSQNATVILNFAFYIILSVAAFTYIRQRNARQPLGERE